MALNFTNAYPSAPDGHWGKTVQGPVVTHEFYFQDGTADGWLLDAGETEIMDQPWPNGTVTMATTGDVGPAGYSLYIQENIPSAFQGDPMWGYIMSPKFEVSHGDIIDSLFFIAADRNAAGNDTRVVVDPWHYPVYWHEEGDEGTYQTYGWGSGGQVIYNSAVAVPHPLNGMAYRVNGGFGMLCIPGRFLVNDPLAKEASMQWALDSQSAWQQGTVVKAGWRVGGVLVTVTKSGGM